MAAPRMHEDLDALTGGRPSAATTWSGSRHLNELAHRGERRARWFCGAVGLVLGLALGFALTVRDHPQMDCARDEVQVWVDFDAGTTRCVDQDDHGSHAGR